MFDKLAYLDEKVWALEHARQSAEHSSIEKMLGLGALHSVDNIGQTL